MKNTAVILFLVAMMVFVDAKPKGSCDQGWIPFGNKCYRFCKQILSWEDAVVACEEDGAYLVRINSKSEDEFLAAKVKSLGKNHWWTGGNDKCKKRDWVWESTGNPVSYVNWAKGEPSDTSENCIMMFNTGKWNDGTCSFKYNFICEKRQDRC